MKKLVFILLWCIPFLVKAQTPDEKLIGTVKSFHQSMVNNNTASINQLTDKALSYGHSNGWVETKAEMIKNLVTGYIVYHSYKEDSVALSMNGNMANVRFNANIKASLNGDTAIYNLKVLEVWVKKGPRWLLFARQAVKG